MVADMEISRLRESIRRQKIKKLCEALNKDEGISLNRFHKVSNRTIDDFPDKSLNKARNREAFLPNTVLDELHHGKIEDWYGNIEVPKITMLPYYGVFYPAEKIGEIFLFLPFKSQDISLSQYLVTDEFNTLEAMEVEGLDLWREFIIALVSRNHRLKAPLHPHPCPECFTYFMPKRRRQLYHTKQCAINAGKRTKYREKHPEAKRRNRRKNVAKTDMVS
jgi:hypothetical protein